MPKADFFADILAAKERILAEQEEYVKRLTDKLSEETQRLVELRRTYNEFKTGVDALNANKHR